LFSHRRPEGGEAAARTMPGALLSKLDAEKFCLEPREARYAPAGALLSRVATERRVADGLLHHNHSLDCMDAGVMPSEAIALMALSEITQLTHFVESGVNFGQSTEFFVRYFHRRQQKVRYIAMDIAETDTPSSSIARVQSRYPAQEMQLLKGDAHAILGPLLSGLPPDARVGVFIDGPKQGPALFLGLGCLRHHPQVAFVALHDVTPAQNLNAANGLWWMTENATLWTGDTSWRSHFGQYDAPCVTDERLAAWVWARQSYRCEPWFRQPKYEGSRCCNQFIGYHGTVRRVGHGLAIYSGAKLASALAELPYEAEAAAPAPQRAEDVPKATTMAITTPALFQPAVSPRSSAAPPDQLDMQCRPGPNTASAVVS
jgi:hypothetical protein